MRRLLPLVAMLALAPGARASLPSYSFSTGNATSAMAMASRPGDGVLEIEAADDFQPDHNVTITGATFIGLIGGGRTVADVTHVVAEIYRVFPKDSDTTRTSNVPTRANSPSDTSFASRDSTSGGLTFTTTLLNPSFGAANSVRDGIHPLPTQTTGGDGAVTGQEVRFTVTFPTPLDLPADHYFFVPQVGVTGGTFYWLSADRPIVAPGTPFAGDLQAWIRDGNLAPDWLRVGTDIVGSGAFNAAFSLSGANACPTISLTGTAPAATTGSPYHGSFSAAGGSAPYTFGATGTAPPGVSFNPDGTLSGTPTQAGSFPFTVTATDADGCAGRANANVTVTNPPPPSQTPAPAVLTALSLSPAAFRPTKGTHIRFTLDRASAVGFSATRLLPGRRGAHGRCVKPRRANRRHRRCSRTVTLAGAFTTQGHAGANAIAFHARIGGHRLARGRYRLLATPAGGATSSAPFRVK
jgi:hypothetical protein